MGLEQRVLRAVNSWDIVIEGKPGFEQLLKDAYYGIGIALTTKAMKALIPICNLDHTTNTKLNYHDAVDEFKLKYLIENYARCGFDFKRTNQECQIAKNEKTAWNIMDYELKKQGLKFRDIKKIKRYEPQLYETNFSNEDEVIGMIVKEIKNYGLIAGKSSFLSRGLEKGKMEISRIFVEVAKKELTGEGDCMNLSKFYGTNYHEAIKKFKKAYLTQQYFEQGKNGKLAAERAGMSYKVYNGALTRIVGMGFDALDKTV